MKKLIVKFFIDNILYLKLIFCKVLAYLDGDFKCIKKDDTILKVRKEIGEDSLKQCDDNFIQYLIEK